MDSFDSDDEDAQKGIVTSNKEMGKSESIKNKPGIQASGIKSSANQGSNLLGSQIFNNPQSVPKNNIPGQSNPNILLNSNNQHKPLVLGQKPDSVPSFSQPKQPGPQNGFPNSLNQASGNQNMNNMNKPPVGSSFINQSPGLGSNQGQNLPNQGISSNNLQNMNKNSIPSNLNQGPFFINSTSNNPIQGGGNSSFAGIGKPNGSDPLKNGNPQNNYPFTQSNQKVNINPGGQIVNFSESGIKKPDNFSNSSIFSSKNSGNLEPQHAPSIDKNEPIKESINIQSLKKDDKILDESQSSIKSDNSNPQKIPPQFLPSNQNGIFPGNQGMPAPGGKNLSQPNNYIQPGLNQQGSNPFNQNTGLNKPQGSPFPYQGSSPPGSGLLPSNQMNKNPNPLPSPSSNPPGTGPFPSSQPFNGSNPLPAPSSNPQGPSTFLSNQPNKNQIPFGSQPSSQVKPAPNFMQGKDSNPQGPGPLLGSRPIIPAPNFIQNKDSNPTGPSVYNNSTGNHHNFNPKISEMMNFEEDGNEESLLEEEAPIDHKLEEPNQFIKDPEFQPKINNPEKNFNPPPPLLSKKKTDQTEKPQPVINSKFGPSSVPFKQPEPIFKLSKEVPSKFANQVVGETNGGDNFGPMVNSQVKGHRPLNLKINAEIPRDKIDIIPVKYTQEQILAQYNRIFDSLFDLLDYNELIFEYDSIIQKLNNDKSTSPESNNVLNHFLNRLKCEKCNSRDIKALFELNCSHIFCKSCLEKLAYQAIQKKIFQCPYCTKQIKDSEELKIWEFIQLDKDQCKIAQLKQKYRNEKQLKCKHCKKFRKTFYDCCLHVCKECFAESSRWKIAPCVKCHDSIFYENLLKETFKCDNCSNITFFIGSYGKYFKDEAYVFCLNCSYDLFNEGFNSKFQITLSKLDKLELNDHIFAPCDGCKDEIFKNLLNHYECNHKLCEKCGRLNVCVACNPR